MRAWPSWRNWPDRTTWWSWHRARAKSGNCSPATRTAPPSPKRAESLQDTPISITAFSDRTLEARGIQSTDGLAQLTPNMTLQNNPSFSGASNSASIYIRGVGQQDFVPTVEPGVGVYVDGVYVARSVGAILDLVDFERIEVLRGPQGTLFGRNTIGGAISITTKAPEHVCSASGSAT